MRMKTKKRIVDEGRESVDNAIENLRLRVRRLENPPKFKIGETIMFEIEPEPSIYSYPGGNVATLPILLEGKIKWVEYCCGNERPTYTIFCPEREDIYRFDEKYVSKKEPKTTNKK